MNRRIALFALTAPLLVPTFARAADPTPAPTPAALSAAEEKFIAAARTTLIARYPTPATAEKAGYVRYTNEDDTGAISYANNHWESTSIAF
jgi:hypothetical protein